MKCNIYSSSESSKTLSEDNLWSILLILSLADPCGAEGRQVGQNCTPTPHQEVSVFGAGDANIHPHVCRHQAPNLSLKSLRQAWQQSIPTCNQRSKEAFTQKCNQMIEKKNRMWNSFWCKTEWERDT